MLWSRRKWKDNADVVETNPSPRLFSCGMEHGWSKIDRLCAQIEGRVFHARFHHTPNENDEKTLLRPNRLFASSLQIQAFPLLLLEPSTHCKASRTDTHSISRHPSWQARFPCPRPRVQLFVQHHSPLANSGPWLPSSFAGFIRMGKEGQKGPPSGLTLTPFPLKRPRGWDCDTAQCFEHRR